MSLPLRIGTRGSPLALAQTREVRDRLVALDPALGDEGAIEIVTIRTTGDKSPDSSFAALGGKGLFTREIDAALAMGRIDAAVHSMKDMPTTLPEGFVLAAVPEREDWRDGFVSLKARCLDELAAGAVVGTASLRRAAQVLDRRPDLRVRPLRGNVETRLFRLGEGTVDAVILAMAGLRRLGLDGRVTRALSAEEMLPAVAQGALGVTCRAEDERALALLATLDHAPSRQAVVAERAFLAALDGSCRTPIAGLAEIDGEILRFRGLVLSPDGADKQSVEAMGSPEEAYAIGRAAGLDLLGRCPAGLIEAGGTG